MQFISSETAATQTLMKTEITLSALEEYFLKLKLILINIHIKHQQDAIRLMSIIWRRYYIKYRFNVIMISSY